MKIFNVSQAYQVYQKQKVQKSGKIQETAKPNLNIEISSKGKDFQFAMEQLRKVPDIRRDKVEAISEKIKDGTYKVDTKRLAQTMRSYLLSDGSN